MPAPADITNMALFCDFENIALGVRDARYASFDIRCVLERLLLKGSIVVKKAYCDWERYREFKAPMHEAAFELIEIPHVRQSGKNSADIRMVVDALDLCYTKAHVDTFVIISGDSDFSPLVSKLRENNKHVIGIGVRDSTSDLLAANCDEFIFYDDLVRARRSRRRASEKNEKAGDKPEKAEKNERTAKAEKGDRNEKPEKNDKPEKADKGEKAEKAEKADRKSGRAAKDAEPATAPRERAEQASEDRSEAERRREVLDFAVETVEALSEERGGDERIWGSMVKQTMKRRRPGFNEAAYGYRSFRAMIEDAQERGLLVLLPDEKTGQYAVRLPLGDED